MAAFAQVQSGNIYGHVKAKDGSLLPGVTVTLTGVGAPQTMVTDTTGDFHFINLSPGTYSVKAELAGFGTAMRTGLAVHTAQNADITITLSPAAAESITVSGEAPVLDVRKTGTGINVSKVELQNVPTGRDPWVIMQQTPGVLLDRINVGGNQSGQQSGYVSKGQTSDQSSWNVDGVTITDVGALGSTPTYYDFDSFEEMQVTTGGSDPRIMTPGVQMNFVTKRGTNDWKGSGRWFHTDNSWQANPSIPAEASSYLQRVNQIEGIQDRGLEVGGPILKDKAWIWGAYSRNNVNLLTATLLDKTNPNSRFLDKTLLANENLKFNAQPFASNSFVASDSYGDKVKLGRNASPTRPPETTYNQADVYRGNKAGSLANPTVWKVEDTQIIGSSLYLTGLYSEVQGGFHLVASGAPHCLTLACSSALPVAYQDAGGVWHNSYRSYESVRPQYQARLDGSKFFDTGAINHELKFGFGYRHANVVSISSWPGNQYVTACPGCGDGSDTNGVALTRGPLTNFTYHAAYNDAYVGDTITYTNLTIQASLRYDNQKGSIDPGTLGPNTTAPDLVPGVTWGSISGLKWNNVSPRVGLTYALGADKRTLLRAAYNRYVDQVGGSWIYNASPGNYSYIYYYFKDLNGDHVAQRNEIDTAYGPAFWNAIDPNNPTAPLQYYRWASNLKSPKTDEFIVGAEHELMQDFTVGVTGTYRKMTDFIWNIGEHTQGKGDVYTPADYVQAPQLTLCVSGSAGCSASSTTKVVAFLPGGQTSMKLNPYYVLKPGMSAPVFFVTENRPGYSQNYWSIDLSATKRLAQRWMLRGNFTLQDWKQQVSEAGIANPTRGRSSGGSCTTCDNSPVIVGGGTGSGSFGGVYINSKWAYNVTGTYQIPVIETNFGVNLTGRQGYAIPYVYRVTTPDGTGGGTEYVLLENDPTQYRHPALTELDLRLAKDIRVYRGAGLTLSIDAFNILNKQTILQRDVQRVTLGSSNHITELQSPRVFRLGARVTF